MKPKVIVIVIMSRPNTNTVPLDAAPPSQALLQKSAETGGSGSDAEDDGHCEIILE